MATDAQIATLSAAMRDGKLACLYLIPSTLDLQGVQLYHHGCTTGDLSALLKHQDSTRVLEEFTLVPAAHSNFADCLFKAKVSSYKANGKGTGKRETLKLSPHDLFKVKIILNSISASIETQHSGDTKSPPKLVKKRSKEDQELAPSNKKPKVAVQKTTDYQEMFYLE